MNPAERNALVGIKPTVGLTSRSGYGLVAQASSSPPPLRQANQIPSVIPESHHQDTVGAFARTVRDAVYALDAIYGVDPRDNFTLAQQHKVPAEGYVQYLTDRNALEGVKFGLPWQTFWVLASEEQRAFLTDVIHEIENAGATIVNGTEMRDFEKIVSPTGWDW